VVFNDADSQFCSNGIAEFEDKVAQSAAIDSTIVEVESCQTVNNRQLEEFPSVKTMPQSLTAITFMGGAATLVFKLTLLHRELSSTSTLLQFVNDVIARIARDIVLLYTPGAMTLNIDPSSFVNQMPTTQPTLATVSLIPTKKLRINRVQVPKGGHLKKKASNPKASLPMKGLY